MGVARCGGMGNADTGPFSAVARFVRDDSMSIALFTLFAVCAALQSVTGWTAYSGELKDAGLPAVGYLRYLATGDFLDGMASNWQAAILQLAVLVAFSSVLRQRGAAHSRKLAHDKPELLNARTFEVKLFRRRRSLGEWVYANSLSLVFFAVFAVVFAAHAVFGALQADEQRALRHLSAQGMAGYVGSAGFWRTVFQTWEAEFFAIGFYIVLSIFLRQESSPESKPLGASNEDTGETNH